MRVVHVKEAQPREACLARLCAEVYGHEAGLAPLATFAGTLGVLFRQEAARLVALVDDASRPVALALLVFDREGRSVELALLTGLEEAGVDAPAERLVAALAERMPLRVNATDATQQAMFERCGIARWLEAPGDVRIGLAPQHPETGLADLPTSLNFDGNAVVQSFKQDRSLFEGYKKRFVRGLESFPTTL